MRRAPRNERFFAVVLLACFVVSLAWSARMAAEPPAASRPATAPATRPAGVAGVRYVIRRAPTPPPLDAAWDSPGWARAGVIDVAWFHPAGSDHHPRTQARLLHDDDGLYVYFRVEDRYVLSTHTKTHSEVCVDSAVELFLEPPSKDPGTRRGYFDIEANCGGNFLFSFNENGKSAFVDPAWMSKLRVHHSLPERVEPEIKEPVTWTLAYFVPFALLDQYASERGLKDRGPWRANLYKVAEANSHPHYGAWQPINGPLTFHKPECFAEIAFER